MNRSSLRNTKMTLSTFLWQIFNVHLLLSGLLWLELCAGKRLQIVTIQAPPFMSLDHEGALEGYLYDLLEELSERMQLSYNLELVADERFGKQDKYTGQWNGLIGSLVNGKADMALAPLTITFKRERVIDFSIPYMTTGLAMLYRRPEPGLQQPFSSLLELVQQNKIDYGVLKDGSTFEFFQYSSFSLFREIAQTLQRNPDRLADSMQEAVDMVRRWNYTFIGEEMLLRYWTGQQPCDLTVIKSQQPVANFGYGFAFPQGNNNSELISDINYKILELREDGTLHRLEAKWWHDRCSRPPMCVCEQQNGVTRQKPIADAGQRQSERERDQYWDDLFSLKNKIRNRDEDDDDDDDRRI